MHMKSESLSRATAVLRTHRCWRHRFECGGKEGGGAGDGGGDGDVAAPGSGLARAMATAPYVKLGLGFWGVVASADRGGSGATSAAGRGGWSRRGRGRQVEEESSWRGGRVGGEEDGRRSRWLEENDAGTGHILYSPYHVTTQ
jgi:hypothetical protein